MKEICHQEVIKHISFTLCFIVIINGGYVIRAVFTSLFLSSSSWFFGLGLVSNNEQVKWLLTKGRNNQTCLENVNLNNVATVNLQRQYYIRSINGYF